MNCPVVGKYEEHRKLVIHGGAVHFSKEQVRIGSKEVFGEVLQPDLSGKDHSGSAKGEAPSYLTGMSQEHGILEDCGSLFERARAGDTIQALPAHSCLTANLMREYFTTDGKRITTLNS
jgi:D-serine deaminase-like pyridoxal phosphate-dependent protein